MINKYPPSYTVDSYAIDVNKVPLVHLSEELRQTIMAYAYFAKEGEISGLGLASLVKNPARIRVQKVFILEQISSGVGTELNPTDIIKIIHEMRQEGLDPALLKLWFHSHGDMDVFWSSRDWRTIDGFRTNWFLSIVVNRAGDMLARLDLYEPMRITVEPEIITTPSFLGINVDKIRNEIAEKNRVVKPKRKRK